MAATAHALLGPSSSHRWLNCTPSARLGEHVSDTSSDFAQEGSCAHALCEEKLWRLLGDEEKAVEAYNEQLSNGRDKWFCGEMDEAADFYVSVVWNKYQEALQITKDAMLFVERTLSFEKWIPDSFGTADAIIITDGVMEVIDFKYGKGVEVSAVSNTQMMIYALGAVAEFEDEYRIDSVRMTIVQPRIHNLSEDEIPEPALATWGRDILKPKAAQAYEGAGEQEPGSWCRFCKVKAQCAALANKALSVYTKHENKMLIPDNEMPSILALLPTIKSWAKDVEDYATAQAINGKQYEGYKIVEGRSIRKVTDQETLIERLSDGGYSTEDILKPQELKTITELEKLVGKKHFAELSEGCVDKPQGKPTLVPDTDKRAPMSVNTAAEDFKGIV